MKKSWLIIFVIAISLITLLGACSSGVGSESTSSSSGSSENKSESSSSQKETSFYDELKAKGKIRVGSTTTGPPFTFMNTDSGKIEGLMVDIANKVGDELGLEVEVIDTKFSSLIPAIEAGRLDMISAGMLITEDRAKIIDFSQPIYPYGEGLVVSKDNNEIKTFDDLTGKKVGVQEGTVYLDGIQDYPEVEYQSYKSIADMMKELDNGRIDAFFGDFPIIADMLKNNPDFNVKLVRDTYEPKWVGEVGLGFPRGTETFQQEVNKVIDKLQENGELDEIIEGWGL